MKGFDFTYSTTAHAGTLRAPVKMGIQSEVVPQLKNKGLFCVVISIHNRILAELGWPPMAAFADLSIKDGNGCLSLVTDHTPGRKLTKQGRHRHTVKFSIPSNIDPWKRSIRRAPCGSVKVVDGRLTFTLPSVLIE